MEERRRQFPTLWLSVHLSSVLSAFSSEHPTEDCITKRFSIICNFKEHKWYAIIYNVRKIMTITILSPERFTFSFNLLLERLGQTSSRVSRGSWVEKGQASHYSNQNMSAVADCTCFMPTHHRLDCQGGTVPRKQWPRSSSCYNVSLSLS